MIDFLDHIGLSPTLYVEARRSTIHCDSDACQATITVSHDITESQSAAIARAAGWTAQMGARRFVHHCERCSEVKR